MWLNKRPRFWEAALRVEIIFLFYPDYVVSKRIFRVKYRSYRSFKKKKKKKNLNLLEEFEE